MVTPVRRRTDLRECRYVSISEPPSTNTQIILSAYPQIFHQLSDEQIQISSKALSQPMPPRHSHDSQTRIFNLDIAKVLFQCSALMYERTSEPLQGALKSTREALHKALPSQKPTVDPSISQPGEVLQTAVGSATAKKILASLHQNNNEESEMASFAARLKIEYATVSELNSQSSAFCGCFWDPKSNYIIVAFKGTEPTEFDEWAGDFSYEPVEAGDYIRGFGRVHGGFMERIFPRRIEPGERLPYCESFCHYIKVRLSISYHISISIDTIRDAVRHTATSLSQNLPLGTKINVWFTGHSLGTALASLVYARAVNEPHEFGEDVVLRDAYLFATPIIADVQSVRAFHNRLNHDPRRMMWRVTNGLDAVATALPDAGDNTAIPLGEYNLFSFAHLGMELTLREAPQKSVVGGNAFPHGTIVRIESGVTTRPGPATPPHKVSAADEQAIEKLHKWEKIPILGRVLAHAPALYWYMLQNIQLGECEWQD